MGKTTEKHTKSIRLFENEFLEKLTHVHPITPLIMWTPVVSFCIYHSLTRLNLSLSTVAIIGIVAVLSWSLFEYVMHRYIFHLEGNNRFTKRLLYLIHGIHHDDPHDPTRLVMPPVPGIILGSLVFGLLWLLLGPVYVYPFFAFFIVGYLIYDYTHYAIHHFRPRTVVGKYIKKYHYTHHFADPESKWGVSSPLWDYILGSAESKNVMRASALRTTVPGNQEKSYEYENVPHL